MDLPLDALILDRDHSYEQIARVWTCIVDRREMPCSPSSLRKWAAQAIATISTLPIPEDKRDDAWSMLVWLYCKSLYPEWDGDPLAAMGASSGGGMARSREGNPECETGVK